MGTLLAYSAIGVTKAAIGSPLAEHEKDGGAAGQSIASAAALGGVFRVYTGMSMAIRRYLAWRPRSKAPSA
jgi:hypothetical protein